MILRKAVETNPTLMFRIAMAAVAVALVGQYFARQDFVKGMLMGAAIGLQIVAMFVMRRHRCN